MHLNGIGAVRNCKMAVELLKRDAGLQHTAKKGESLGVRWRFYLSLLLRSVSGVLGSPGSSQAQRTSAGYASDPPSFAAMPRLREAYELQEKQSVSAQRASIGSPKTKKER